MLTVEQVIALEQMTVLVSEERWCLCFSILLCLTSMKSWIKIKVPDHMYDALKELVTSLLNKKSCKGKKTILIF